MVQYTVSLTDSENMALSYITLSQQDWIDNAVHERCRIAVEEIVQLTIQKCLENSMQIPSSKDGMVSLAFEQDWIQTAEQRNAIQLS